MADTQTPKRHPILDAIVDVVQNKKDTIELRNVCGKARVEMAELRQDIEGTIEALAAEVKEKVQAEIAHVRAGLDIYQDGLNLIDEYFKDKQVNTLIRGGDFVRRGNVQTNAALANFRNASLIAMGPTDIPDYNLLHRMRDKIKSGQMQRDGAFGQNVERFAKLTEMAVGETNQAPPTLERDSVLAAYRRHMEALEMLRKYVKEGREELLEKGMLDLKDTYTHLRELLPAVQLKLRTAVPTRSPVANYAINTAAEYAAGRATDANLQDAFEQLRRNFENLKREVDGVMRSYIESVMVREEAEKVLAALKQEEEALDLLYGFFARRDMEMLLAGCHRLKTAVDRQHEAHLRLNELADQQGKTLCLQCQHYNPRNRRTCEKCSARLIVPEDTSVPSTISVQDQSPAETMGAAPVPVYANVERILVAAHNVDANKITMEEFAAEIDWFENVVNVQEAGLAKKPSLDPQTAPEQYREAAQQLVKATDQAEADFHEAVADFRAAIANFRVYMEDVDKDTLMEGTRLMWAGNTKIHEIQTGMRPLQQHMPEASEATSDSLPVDAPILSESN